MDSVDALLFWINKICDYRLKHFFSYDSFLNFSFQGALVRETIERDGIVLQSNDLDATIPEMEDLYEDLGDGTCICSLLHFYNRKDVCIKSNFASLNINKINVNEIYFENIKFL